MLPIDKYMGCNWFFPNESVVVASEYRMIDSNLAPIGKETSVVFHHNPVFCSLYIRSSSCYNDK